MLSSRSCESFTKPELVIVTDGEYPHFNLKLNDLQGIRLHVIALANNTLAAFLQKLHYLTKHTLYQKGIH